MNSDREEGTMAATAKQEEGDAVRSDRAQASGTSSAQSGHKRHVTHRTSNSPSGQT